MYTNRYQYRKAQATQYSSIKSKLIMGGVIFGIALLCNIIVELPLYQHIIVALS